MSFTVATYNILADSYIKPEWYPHTPRNLLAAPYRLQALGNHIIQLDADILCLQEVEFHAFQALNQQLTLLDYTGFYNQKQHNKPDGCALFFRTAKFQFQDDVAFAYQDGRDGLPDSGHIVQLVLLEHEGHSLGIANTHLKWEAWDTPPEKQIRSLQVNQLLQACRDHFPVGAAWIVCGDLNVTSKSDVVVVLREAGLEFAHHAIPNPYTCNSNARAKTLDYIFHTSNLQASPLPLPTIDDQTPLPGPEQPSDHVAVLAHFEWAI